MDIYNLAVAEVPKSLIELLEKQRVSNEMAAKLSGMAATEFMIYKFGDELSMIECHNTQRIYSTYNRKGG